jgi:hypothetical protein
MTIKNDEITEADREAAESYHDQLPESVLGKQSLLELAEAFARHRLAAAAAERERWIAACNRVSGDSARNARNGNDEEFHEGRMTACAAVVQLATTEQAT